MKLAILRKGDCPSGKTDLTDETEERYHLLLLGRWHGGGRAKPGGESQ